MRELVWLTAWQFQCCGERASVADTVTWQVTDLAPDALVDELGTQWHGRVRLAEDHHDTAPDRRPASGTVTSIRELTHRTADGVDDQGRDLTRAAGTGRLRYVHTMDPRGPEPERRQGIGFVGWIVELERPG